jgi:YbbR domain-containing protein
VPYSGTLGLGYHITGINVKPNLVTLQGSSDAFDQLPGYVETFPVNIDQATEDIDTQVALDLPESLAVVGLQSVGVRINVDPLTGSRNYEIEPVIRGLGPELTRTIPLETVSVLVRGPLPTLDDLDSGQIQMLLDLTGLEPGAHPVPMTPVVPEGVDIISILPESVDITILPLATPTPVPVQGTFPRDER